MGVPRPELLKVMIDLRPKYHERTNQPHPERSDDPDLSSILAKNQKSRASDSQQRLEAGGIFVWCSPTSFL